MEMGNRPSNERPPVMFVPGGVMPAALAYGPLLEVIRDEIQGIKRAADVAGFCCRVSGATQKPGPDRACRDS